MSDARTIVVVTTVGTRAEARAMARTLVAQQFAACAQIAEIESFYSWEGEIRDEGEFRLWFKTAADRYDALEAAIRGLHPYELPAIYAVPVAAAFGPYAEWVVETARG